MLSNKIKDILKTTFSKFTFYALNKLVVKDESNKTIFITLNNISQLFTRS